MSQPQVRSAKQVYIEEGEEAFENEIPKEHCPYAFDDPIALYWCKGWDAAEFANEEENRSTQQDQQLDDPHRGAV